MAERGFILLQHADLPFQRKMIAYSLESSATYLSFFLLKREDPRAAAG